MTGNKILITEIKDGKMERTKKASQKNLKLLVKTFFFTE